MFIKIIAVRLSCETVVIKMTPSKNKNLARPIGSSERNGVSSITSCFAAYWLASFNFFQSCETTKKTPQKKLLQT